MTSRRLVLLAVGCALAFVLAACVPAPPLDVSATRTGLDVPWDVRWTPADANPAQALVYTERPNGLSIVANDQVILHWKPTDLLVASEAGMMSVELAPDFTTSRRVFVCFASTRGPDVRIARLVLAAGYRSITNRTDIVTGVPLNPVGELGRHSGCRLRFGPDGYLWVGTGDAAVGTNPQSPTSLGGKVLRIDQNGAGAPGNASPPFDPRIRSWGHRNVQGLAFRGNQAFGIEQGSDCDDEVNRLVVGNYGWDPVPRSPGAPQYDESAPMTDLARFPNAIRASWSSGCPTIATAGGTFVDGPWWKAWDGGLVLAALKGTQLRMIRLTADGSTTTAVSVAVTDRGRLRTPVIGPDAALYVTTGNGASNDVILRITPHMVASSATPAG
ncbi:MAG: PQQ-dependent sugar dehydrogenase [Acidimicrobiia bacterium]